MEINGHSPLLGTISISELAANVLTPADIDELLAQHLAPVRQDSYLYCHDTTIIVGRTYSIREYRVRVVTDIGSSTNIVLGEEIIHP